MQGFNVQNLMQIHDIWRVLVYNLRTKFIHCCPFFVNILSKCFIYIYILWKCFWTRFHNRYKIKVASSLHPPNELLTLIWNTTLFLTLFFFCFTFSTFPNYEWNFISIFSCILCDLVLGFFLGKWLDSSLRLFLW